MSDDINVGQLSEAINNKADRDINNLTDGGYEKASGLGMPSGRYTYLTVGASESLYTAPANGWYSFKAQINTVGNIIRVALSNETTHLFSSASGHLTGANVTQSVYIPVKKNDTCKILYGNTTNEILMFIYAEGEPNE